MNSALTFKQLVVVTLIVLAGVQLIPVERTNPPVESRTVGPQPVMDLFRRACFECHSNETVWPWYAKVAPMSWFAVRDVDRGRAKLNFSTWNQLSSVDQDRLKAEIWKQMSIGDMPPPLYMLGNPDSQVTTEHQRMLRGWCGLPPN